MLKKVNINIFILSAVSMQQNLQTKTKFEAKTRSSLTITKKKKEHSLIFKKHLSPATILKIKERDGERGSKILIKKLSTDAEHIRFSLNVEHVKTVVHVGLVVKTHDNPW